MAAGSSPPCVAYLRLQYARQIFLSSLIHPSHTRLARRICGSLSPMPNAEDKSIDRLRVAMASTNELFNSEVFGKQNFDALDEIYTEEARILPPGADIISGRKAIKE